MLPPRVLEGGRLELVMSPSFVLLPTAKTGHSRTHSTRMGNVRIGTRAEPFLVAKQIGKLATVLLG